MELFAHIGWFVSAHILLRGGNAVSITLQLGWAQPRRERLRERDGLAVSTTRKTEGKRQQRQNHHPIQLHLGHLLSGCFHPPRQHESTLFEAREWEIVATKERTRRCFRVNALGHPADRKICRAVPIERSGSDDTSLMSNPCVRGKYGEERQEGAQAPRRGKPI